MPGSDIVWCCDASTVSGTTFPATAWALFFNEPVTIWSFPAIMASYPSRATSAGSSLDPAPTLVSCIPARSKNSVAVGPGINAVTVTPVSFSSSRSACENDNKNALEGEPGARGRASVGFAFRADRRIADKVLKGGSLHH